MDRSWKITRQRQKRKRIYSISEIKNYNLKKLQFLLFIPFLYSSSTENEVYICNSKNATKFHFNQFCRGLSACKKETKTVTLKEAKDKKLTLCSWEKY
jgi:hypothetical protein